MPDRFEVRRENDRRLVLRGELDVASAGQLATAVREALGISDSLTLDLRHVTFIDSTGLRTIIGSARELEGRGTLVLEDPSPRVVEVMEIAGLIGAAPNLILKRNNEERL